MKFFAIIMLSVRLLSWIDVNPVVYINHHAMDIAEAKTGVFIDGEVTAYTSDPLETDDTPFLTASNQKVRNGIVANNCLPFGTRIIINGKQFEVQDRMNKRYGCDKFDIWHESKKEALKFGRQNLRVEIIQ